MLPQYTGFDMLWEYQTAEFHGFCWIVICKLNHARDGDRWADPSKTGNLKYYHMLIKSIKSSKTEARWQPTNRTDEDTSHVRCRDCCQRHNMKKTWSKCTGEFCHISYRLRSHQSRQVCSVHTYTSQFDTCYVPRPNSPCKVGIWWVHYT